MVHRKHAADNLATPIASLFGIDPESRGPGSFYDTSEPNFRRMVVLRIPAVHS